MMTQQQSIKDIFLANKNLWKPIFGTHVNPNSQPVFSVFRKKIQSSLIGKFNIEEIALTILYLKSDGKIIKRNGYANELEI